MNERIRELIKQHGVDITIDGMGYGEGNIEGLAELIVRERAEFLLFKAEKAMSQEIVAVSDDLLKHFGVEE